MHPTIRDLGASFRSAARSPAFATLVLGVAWVGAVFARTSLPERQQLPEGVFVQQGPRVEQAAPSQGKPGEPPASPVGPGQAPAGEFVGDETCLTCHEEQKQGYANTMHGRADHPRSPAAKQGCETCHGPGAKHVDDPEVPVMIRAFSQEPPRENNATCLTCHGRGAHALWEGSVHEARNLSCSGCHSVHAFKSEKSQLKTVREMDTCATCHRDKAAKVDRSGHMPLREGKMECSTCHNPHGSTNVRQLRRGDSIAEACTSCHADKRGPYLWEHAPSRDGCTTCHDPHGSSNERMLVTRPPILCQRCHVATRHPSTIYDGGLIGSGATPSVRIYTRSCVTCHSNIHGSNHPSGQRFIR
jgi:DmsE family decaheme c-type cytochrome